MPIILQEKNSPIFKVRIYSYSMCSRHCHPIGWMLSCPICETGVRWHAGWTSGNPVIRNLGALLFSAEKGEAGQLAAFCLRWDACRRESSFSFCMHCFAPQSGSFGWGIALMWLSSPTCRVNWPYRLYWERKRETIYFFWGGGRGRLFNHKFCID